MTHNRPSTTAQRVAIHRAEHQILDRPPVFDDPLALRIIGTAAASQLASGHARPHDIASRSMRAFMAARSRYAEDQLAAAVDRGVSQFVILGAGLDTFAYRNPFSESNLTVFEVDHPATQGWKRVRLEETGIAAPRSVTFVPVDFSRQSLQNELTRTGFDPRKGAFFSWLGVTQYLARKVVIETLRWVHSISQSNGIVFDYALPRRSLNWLNRIAFDGLARRVALAGEPFQGFFDPAELANELHSIGFRHVEDLGPDEINVRYFRGRRDGLK
ncbi:MAG: class I SAM-dependent methyltransferase, partial [Bryobacteraceae bacterium]